MAEPDYVQPRDRHDGPIFLATYDPEWAVAYQELAAAIRDALGDTAVEVEHVGSTSVPGLDAKPIIDIDLVVPDSADESSYVDRLVQIGYELLAARMWAYVQDYADAKSDVIQEILAGPSADNPEDPSCDTRQRSGVAQTP